MDNSNIINNSDGNDGQQSQWIAVHNDKIINFYGSQQDAVDGLNSYCMNNLVGIDDILGTYQII